MKSEFVPYEQALALKELGYDEPCLAWFDMIDFELFIEENEYSESNKDIVVLAPTFSQALRWFREKYELHSCIHSDYTWNISGGIWDLNEYKGSRYDWDYSNNYLTYEEAELSSLEKLIEIVESHT
jgi:hypothetical protein